MLDNDKIIENPESVKNNLEYNETMKKIREELIKRFSDYRKTMDKMTTDAPIAILCLPKAIETCLFDHGCRRIYDLFDVDFTEVKGLGVRRIGDLTASLDKFFSML